MSTSRAAARWQAGLVCAVAVLLVLLGDLGPARADSGTPTPTSVVVTITPSGPVRTTTPVTYRAEVTPASAAGRVLFTFEQSGTAIAYADCIEGVSVFEAKLHQLGTQLVTARFLPDNPGEFAASTSATVPLVITMTPTVSLATSTGSLLASGAQVAPSEQLVALIAGFVPGSRASVTFDGTVIVPSIVVGGDTRGSAPLIVPTGLAVGTHSLVARSGALSASLQVVVTSPTTVVVVPVTGTPAPAATPTPAPTPPTTVSAGIPDTGSRSALAQTGGDPLDLSLGALLLLGFGMLLMRVQAGCTGSHVRAGGAHAVRDRTATGRHSAA